MLVTWNGPEHGTLPKANRAWWTHKLGANARRDRDTDDELTRAGWLVARVWEHEEPSAAAARVEMVVRARASGCGVDVGHDVVEEVLVEPE